MEQQKPSYVLAKQRLNEGSNKKQSCGWKKLLCCDSSIRVEEKTFTGVYLKNLVDTKQVIKLRLCVRLRPDVVLFYKNSPKDLF